VFKIFADYFYGIKRWNEYFNKFWN